MIPPRHINEEPRGSDNADEKEDDYAPCSVCKEPELDDHLEDGICDYCRERHYRCRGGCGRIVIRRDDNSAREKAEKCHACWQGEADNAAEMRCEHDIDNALTGDV